MNSKTDISASLALNQAIVAALQHSNPEPLKHDDIAVIKSRVNYVLDSARSGAFGELYVNNDLQVNYDWLQRMWMVKGKF